MLRRAVPISMVNKPSSAINLVQTRYSFYNKYKHGPLKSLNPQKPWIQWTKDFFTRDGIEVLKEEFNEIWKRNTKTVIPKAITPNKPVIIEHFDTEKSFRKWKPVADSDSSNGYSVSSFTRSPAGHGLFKGITDNRVPDDGYTHESGFAGVIGPGPPRSNVVDLDPHWNWERFNCVEIRFRGDGRKYSFVVSTACYDNDLSNYDTYGFPLYTRGGPYWQTIVIPFSKLLFSHKGFIQDDQGYLPWTDIKFIAFAIHDKVDGPFCLEIDYVALMFATFPFSEYTSYEGYVFPHIKWKPVAVGCDPPEDADNAS